MRRTCRSKQIEGILPLLSNKEMIKGTQTNRLPKNQIVASESAGIIHWCKRRSWLDYHFFRNKPSPPIPLSKPDIQHLNLRQPIPMTSISTKSMAASSAAFEVSTTSNLQKMLSFFLSTQHLAVRNISKICCLVLLVFMSMSSSLSAQEDDLFIITVTSHNNNYQLPMYGSADLNYSIDWDYDGTFAADETTTTTNIIHNYGNNMQRQIAVRIIAGNPWFKANNHAYRNYLNSVDQWGTAVWQNMETAFNGCNAVNVLATDKPDLSLCTSTYAMFKNCHQLATDNLSDWDVGTITRFDEMFSTCVRFNGSLADWNIGEGTGTDPITMISMFQRADAFNQPLETWETNANSTMAYVTNMSILISLRCSLGQDVLIIP